MNKIMKHGDCTQYAIIGKRIVLVHVDDETGEVAAVVAEKGADGLRHAVGMKGDRWSLPAFVRHMLRQKEL